jgi:hypothetical protein
MTKVMEPTSAHSAAAQPSTAQPPVAQPSTAQSPTALPPTARSSDGQHSDGRPSASPSPAAAPTGRSAVRRSPTRSRSGRQKPGRRPATAGRPAAEPALAGSPVAGSTVVAPAGSRPATGNEPSAGPTSPLSAAEIAALALSLAHLGAGPQAVTARRGLRHAFEHLSLGDEVVGATLATLTAPLPAEVASRARVVASAITSRLVIRLHYRDAAARVTVREVEPVTCLVHRDHWYLVGMCRLRGGIRAFRFDRIIAVEPTATPARPHLPERFLPFQRRRTVTAA